MAYYGSLVYLVVALILVPLTIVTSEINAHPSLAFLFRDWAMPTFWDWLIMSGLGLVWASGMYCMARAYSLTFASVIAPFEYVTLLINVLWGFLIWREVPTWLTWIGGLLTIASGLYILYREQKVRTATMTNV